MQEDLNQKTLQYVRKMPFMKALILSELGGDVEVYKYVSSDIQFKEESNPNFLSCLRGGMTELYTDFKSQFSKVCDCQNFQVSVMYDQYFVRKMQIGRNILLIAICETESLDMGALDLMCRDYRTNFLEVDRVIEDLNKQQM